GLPGVSGSVRRGGELHGEQCELPGRQLAAGRYGLPCIGGCLRRGGDPRGQQCGLSGRPIQVGRYRLPPIGGCLRRGGDVPRQWPELSVRWLPAIDPAVPPGELPRRRRRLSVARCLGGEANGSAWWASHSCFLDSSTLRPMNLPTAV